MLRGSWYTKALNITNVEFWTVADSKENIA